jgi:hypothetical protein
MVLLGQMPMRLRRTTMVVVLIMRRKTMSKEMVMLMTVSDQTEHCGIMRMRRN